MRAATRLAWFYFNSVENLFAGELANRDQLLPMHFESAFLTLTGNPPFRWQRRRLDHSSTKERNGH